MKLLHSRVTVEMPGCVFPTNADPMALKGFRETEFVYTELHYDWGRLRLLGESPFEGRGVPEDWHTSEESELNQLRLARRCNGWQRKLAPRQLGRHQILA